MNSTITVKFNKPFNILGVLVCLIFYGTGYAQTSSDQAEFEYREVPDDPYMPPDNKNKKTTKAFQIQAENFFCTQVNIDLAGNNIIGDAANEPSIAINPLNSDEIVIAWRQFDNVQSNFRQAGNAYSTDGGFTWNNTGPLDPGEFRSDPVLDSDGQGRFYFNSLRLLNEEIINDVFQSTNIGSWNEGTYAFGGDKQWMIVEKTETEDPNIYAFWTLNPNICTGQFIRSTDAAATFEPCSEIRDELFNHGTLAIGPERQLYAAGRRGPNYYVSVSANAHLKNEDIVWDTIGRPFLDGQEASRFGPNPGGLLGQVEIEVDNSEGPNRGNVYVLSTVKRFNNQDTCDVMFARSTDGGIEFEPPIRINNDTDPNAYQWFGTMSVAPNGRIDVIWLDTREDPGGFMSALYYSFSEDGGTSWSGNQKLSGSFDPHIGWPNQRKIGDYFDMISVEDGAHIAWAGTFNGEQDVYYGFVSPQLTTATEKESGLTNFIEIDIAPNPSFGAPEIIISSALRLELQFELVDNSGRLMGSNYKEVQGSEILYLRDLIEFSGAINGGIYFLKVSSRKHGSMIRRVVVIGG